MGWIEIAGKEKGVVSIQINKIECVLETENGADLYMNSGGIVNTSCPYEDVMREISNASEMPNI